MLKIGQSTLGRFINEVAHYNPLDTMAAKEAGDGITRVISNGAT